MSNEKTNYFMHFLQTQEVILGGFSSVIVGSIVSFFLAKSGIWVIPMLYCTVAGILAFLADATPDYRLSVDRELRSDLRDELEEEMLEILWVNDNIDPGREKRAAYEEMRSYMEQLEESSVLASSISEDDLEALEDSIISYLSMWCSLKSMKESKRRFNLVAAKEKVADIERSLESITDLTTKKQLQFALDEQGRMITHNANLDNRIIVLETKMSSLYHNFTDIYQRLLGSKAATDFDIKTALDKLQMEEEINLGVDSDMQDLFSKTSKLTNARKPQNQQKVI